jgi:alpha-L-glutamate ligase-like protein
MSVGAFIRWWRAASHAKAKVLTMNQRNLDYIYPNNKRKDFPLADNKLLTKQLLGAQGIPVPETYHSYSSFYEMRGLEKDLSEHHEFVIKPAQGSGGGGILVIATKSEQGWVSVSGHTYTLDDIRKHIADIIFGVYSFDLNDYAIIEARIAQHQAINELSPFGLTDVRVILYQNSPVLAMLRVPTKASDGKANLHQGAAGLGVDIKNGIGVHATHEGHDIKKHPDTGLPMIGFQIPYWQDILDVSRRAAVSVPLKYVGVDLAVADSGPLILEMNVRPGIEIQNANLLGMRDKLEMITAARGV